MSRIPEKLKDHYLWLKQHTADQVYPGFAIEIQARDRIGLIADITRYISSMKASISSIQSWFNYDRSIHILVQIESGPDEKVMREGISRIQSVVSSVLQPTYNKTYGKRVIIIGGGAQVAQVAAGAITEADRHNIRGETVSVDTMAIVGEEDIARSVRGVGRLHRAGILVLAGALMGGEITKAVHELRHSHGIPVMCLKMAGSVRREADLIVTDPTEAGVMAVMLLSHVGRFNLLNIHGREF
jgi:energy-converting hydrogenase B subunit Q